MKQFRYLLLVLSLIFFFPTTNWACDNSFIDLVSMADNGDGTFTYVVQVCIGGGVLGLNTGADGPTETFSLALYTGGNAVTVSDLSPTSITSDETMVTMSSSIQGAFGPPFDSDAMILYLHPGGTAYTCVTSTALCGEPYADCNDITFTTDIELEAITAFGIEGNGNPVAGCTGDTDMTIDLVALPVDLTRFTANAHEREVRLEWETANEIDNEYFAIERSLDGQSFQTVGRVAGNNTTEQTSKYQFVDQPQQSGRHYYRLKQVDFSGEFTYSPIVSAWVHITEKQAVRLYPNPVSAELYLLVDDLDAESISVEVYDHLGQFVDQRLVDWNGQLVLPTDEYIPGMYTLRLYANRQLVAQERFVKM